MKTVVVMVMVVVVVVVVMMMTMMNERLTEGPKLHKLPSRYARRRRYRVSEGGRMRGGKPLQHAKVGVVSASRENISGLTGGRGGRPKRRRRSDGAAPLSSTLRVLRGPVLASSWIRRQLGREGLGCETKVQSSAHETHVRDRPRRRWAV